MSVNTMSSCSLWPTRQSGLLTTILDPPPNIYILCNSDTKLQAITNICSLDNQSSVLSFHHAFMAFTSSHRDTGIHLVWAPVCRDGEQDTMSRKRALHACTIAPLATLNQVQSAAYQKQAVHKCAFQRWAHEWSTACSGWLLATSNLEVNEKLKRTVVVQEPSLTRR